ncbi:MAG: hypothetical protein AAFU70_07395, partial [Planctomycetota bacterium]
MTPQAVPQIASEPDAALRSQRLWHELGSPTARPAPAKGLDLIGEWVQGRAQRRKRVRAWGGGSGSKDARARATRILEAADTLTNHSDAALADHAQPIIERARLAAPDSAHQTIDDAFALLTEVIRRELGFTLHTEQVMGALAMAMGSQSPAFFLALTLIAFALG